MSRRFGAEGIRRPSLREAATTPTPFSPTQISSLWAWWRGDNVTQSSNAISAWPDKSGNGRDMTQTTASLKPTWVSSSANMNNQGAVNFISDGASTFDSLNMPNMSSLTAAEMWIIIRINNDPPSAQTRGGFMQVGTAAGSTLYPNKTDNNILDSWGSTVRRATGDPTPSLAAIRAYSVITTSSEWTNSLDGTQFFTTATNTVGFLASPILGGNGVDVGMDGLVGEMLVFSAKLSTTDRTNLKTYLATRYAITIA